MSTEPSIHAPTLDDVLACPNLPSLPVVAMQVLELARDENVKLDEIALIVQNDPALTAKILKTVNSGFYALAKPCPTIARALAYLGLGTLKSLVLGFSLEELTSDHEGGLDLPDLFRRSLLSAAAARRILQTCGLGDPEEAFVGALMQDVGMLAIHATSAEAYDALVATVGSDHGALARAERTAFGFDHPEAGARLGEHWNLPPSLVAVIRDHHRPNEAPYRELIRAVAFGNETASALRLADPTSAFAELAGRAESWFGLSDEDMVPLLHAISADIEELGRFFDIEADDSVDVHRILAEAQEVALEHQLSLQREAEDLRKTNDNLARQALTDGLTNVGNRKAFDDRLAQSFAEARAMNAPLGLVLVDADHFKRLNDTFGHQAGDAVLVELARRLEAVSGLRGQVCRYGGEEFAIILPDAPLRETALLAEQMRIAVDDEPFEAEGTDPLDVTISLGAAVLDAESTDMLRSVELLITATDRALYAAKDAGRNQVRVFRAAPRAAA